MTKLTIIKKITATTTLAAFLTFGYGGIIAPPFAEAAPRHIRHEHRVHKAHKKPRAFKPMPAKYRKAPKHHIVHRHRPLPHPYPRRRHEDHRRHRNRDAIAAALIGIAIGAVAANNAD